ncbi:hypothetical protein QFZ77_006918 [Paenibacillus sp. V4I3]|uniref:hypothetical protein n=1 Tax=Paenibacillus sp. V4I3 TaxID=3042305 RepID=UPI0027891BCA|nr:hypothetical protein [Paenibacillus sp. V4I3]MDQ0878259.1 hypothetical protein [Paenibacillus sp. V4I3]
MIALAILGLFFIVFFVLIEQIISLIFLFIVQKFLVINKSQKSVSYIFNFYNLGSSFVVKIAILLLSAIIIDIIDQITYVEEQGFQDAFSYIFLSNYVSEVWSILLPCLLVSWILYFISIIRNNIGRSKYSWLHLSLLIINSVFLSAVVLRGVHNISWSV